MNTANEHNPPSWYRARITAIRKLIEELPTTRDEKNPDHTLVRNGFIPDEQKEHFEKILNNEYLLTFSLNEPLSFTDLTSFNTWFVMHPEKICGKEAVTTSREFPITIKGTQDDIVQTIKAGIEQKNVPSEQNSTQSEFHQDTHELEPEQKTENRFGSAKKTLDWEVNKFHSYYHDAVNELEKMQAPLEKQIDELNKSIKETRERAKKKELTAKLNDVINQRNLNKNAFEGDWLNFCMELRNIIIEVGKNKGVQIDDDGDGWYIPDDILLAITDRPGIEHYWKTKISEVIDKEFQYFVNEQKKQDASVLELEALALETELELLNL